MQIDIYDLQNITTQALHNICFFIQTKEILGIIATRSGYTQVCVALTPISSYDITNIALATAFQYTNIGIFRQGITNITLATAF